MIGSVGQRAQDTLDTGAGNNIKQFTFPTLCLDVFYIDTTTDRYLVLSAVWCWAGWLVMKCIGDMTTDNSNLRLV